MPRVLTLSIPIRHRLASIFTIFFGGETDVRLHPFIGSSGTREEFWPNSESSKRLTTSAKCEFVAICSRDSKCQNKRATAGMMVNQPSRPLSALHELLMKLFLVSFALGFASCCSAMSCLAGDGSDRCNVLFILADDQSPFDLKMYNPASTLDTPTLDRLAADGVVFDGAYQMGSWSGAVCTPSRTMIMTGRTVWHLPGKNPLSPNPKYVPRDMPKHTLAAVFKDGLAACDFPPDGTGVPVHRAVATLRVAGVRDLPEV